MASDILEQLAESKIPPVPVDALERGFSERLNNRLVVQQMLDLALRGLPYAALHMLRGMVGVLHYTIAGKFIAPASRNNDADSEVES